MGEESPASPLPAAAAAKVYYDGCPGCAVDRKKETHAGVPYKELLFVATTTFASGTSTYYSLTPDADADAPPPLLLPFLYRSINSNCHSQHVTRETMHVVRSEEGRTTDGLILLPAALLFDL